MEKPRFLVLFSHRLTQDQHRDIRERFGDPEILEAPPEVLRVWGAIPPDLLRLEDFLNPVKNWLEAEARPGDILFIQGEHGATVYGVRLALGLQLLPVYATTKRVVEERVLDDGSVETRREFRHVLFRAYPGAA